MNTSTYYDLKLYEGTDIVNPLVVDVPNLEAIDEIMHDNATESVGLATELTTGSVHAITRDNPDAAVFRFVATANWTAGDTMTVDGIQVTVLLPSGEALGSGAYVINANVLGIITGTLVTIFTSGGTATLAQDSEKLGGQLPSYYGTAEDVQTATTTANAAGVLANNLNNKLSNLIEATLNAGNTSLTFTDNSILASSIIDLYMYAPTGVSVPYVGYNSVTLNVGSVTFEFDEQLDNITFGITVR